VLRRRRDVRRGDTLSFQIQAIKNVQTGRYWSAWPGEALPPNSIPVSLSGWRVIFTAKFEVPDWDNQAVWQLDNQGLGGVTTPSPTGSIAVLGGALNTYGFADGPTRLAYDVEGIDPAGYTWTLETGGIVVLPDVTRAVGGFSPPPPPPCPPCVPCGGGIRVVVGPATVVVTSQYSRYLADTTAGNVTLIVMPGSNAQRLFAQVARGAGNISLQAQGTTLLYMDPLTGLFGDETLVTLGGLGAFASWEYSSALAKWA
jgi:hypothetical protein